MREVVEVVAKAIGGCIPTGLESDGGTGRGFFALGAIGITYVGYAALGCNTGCRAWAKSVSGVLYRPGVIPRKFIEILCRPGFVGKVLSDFTEDNAVKSSSVVGADKSGFGLNGNGARGRCQGPRA